MYAQNATGVKASNPTSDPSNSKWQRDLSVSYNKLVLVSRTVRDLVMGSAIRFVERGLRALTGVPGKWELFGIAAAAAQSLNSNRFAVSPACGASSVRNAPARVPAPSSVDHCAQTKFAPAAAISPLPMVACAFKKRAVIAPVVKAAG